MGLAAKLLGNREAGGVKPFASTLSLLLFFIFLELLLDSFLRNMSASPLYVGFCLAGTLVLLLLAALFTRACLPLFRKKQGAGGTGAGPDVLYRLFLPVSLANLLLAMRGYAFFWEAFGAVFLGRQWLAVLIPAACWLLASLVAFAVLGRLSGNPERGRPLSMTLSLAYLVFTVGFIKVNAEWQVSPLSPDSLLRTGLLFGGVLVAGLFFYRTLVGAVRAGTEEASHGFRRARNGLAAVVALTVLAGMLNLLLNGPNRHHIVHQAFDGQAGDGSRPDIFLLVVDSLRADHLASHGYHRSLTPNLDALAETSTQFQRAVTASTWTLPSVTSIFTGLPAGIHGSFATGFAGALATAFNEELLCSEEIPFLPQRLRSKYRTLALSSNVFASDKYCRGFDEFYEDFSFYTLSLFPHLLGNAYLSPLAQKVYLTAYSWGLLDKDYFYRDACNLNRRALQWLGRHPDSTVFLYIHYMDVHSPFLPSVRRHSRDSGLPAVTFLEIIGKRLEPASVPEEAVQELKNRYDDGILSFDLCLGAFIEALKKDGRFDESLIIVASDHGEEFREHDRFGHGQSVYQELVHVPLLIKLPGQKTGRRLEVPVDLTDLFPTVLATAGIEAEGDFPLSGRDLMPLLQGEEDRFPSKPFLVSEIETGETAILSGDWKLIHRPEEEGETFLLFDLETDPDDKQDRSRARTEEAARLKEDFSRYRTYRDQNRIEVERKKVTPSQVDQLKSLGYIQ